MRVLMTADTVGGVWSYALELARGLGAHDVEVVLATMGGRLDRERRADAEQVPTLVVHESEYRLEWMDDPWSDVERAGEWLSALAADARPDIVHLNGFVHGSLPWNAPVLVVGHSCVLSWWRAVKGDEAPPQWDRYRDAVRRGLRAADVVVAPSRAMLRELELWYGVSDGRVIPNGRNPESFRPLPKEPLVLSAGRLWDEGKNIAALAAIAPRLEWPVYVAGEERHPDGGTASLRTVRPLGRIPEKVLAEWLGRASIYALPARYEPFGLSVLEAALAECALVLGDIPSLREIWGDAATFVPPGDPDALHAALARLIENSSLRQELARGARARALRLTTDRMAAQYRATYGELLSGRGGRAREAVTCAS